MANENRPIKEERTRYSLARRLWIKVIVASAFLRPRSFAVDAQTALTDIQPKPHILGLNNIPRRGPLLITCNHYTRPGLDAWWAPILISALIASQREMTADKEIHWIITAAWTFPDHPWQRKILTPLSRWAFARVARVFGFITMPPMPPTPNEVYARAVAVRRTLRLAHELSPQGGIIGLAPEGRDTAGVVGSVPAGVGDFIAHLCKVGFPVLPVAFSEDQGHLRVSFGQSFMPTIPRVKADRDKSVADQVMNAISRQVLK